MAIPSHKRKHHPLVDMAIFHDLCDILREYNIKWVSEQSGVTTATMYYWLDGHTKQPRLSTCLKVAAALGYELVLQKQRDRSKYKKPVLRRVK